MPRYDPKGKYVLITGASTGIGRKMARVFAAKGANLILGSLPSEAGVLEAWAAELKAKYGVETYTAPEDLATEQGPARLYEKAKSLAPRIDVLVNNAGAIAYGEFHKTPLVKHERVFNVNARAVMVLMRLFLDDMVERGHGRILNVASVAAFTPTPHHAVYGATKAFIQMLSEASRAELHGTGVDVCTLNPCYTDTPLLHGEGFPKRLWWYSISGLKDPAWVAEDGVDAFLRGKAVHVPGLWTWFSHVFLIRFTPRWVMRALAVRALKSRNGSGRSE